MTMKKHLTFSELVAAYGYPHAEEIFQHVRHDMLDVEDVMHGIEPYLNHFQSRMDMWNNDILTNRLPYLCRGIKDEENRSIVLNIYNHGEDLANSCSANIWLLMYAPSVMPSIKPFIDSFLRYIYEEIPASKKIVEDGYRWCEKINQKRVNVGRVDFIKTRIQVVEDQLEELLQMVKLVEKLKASNKYKLEDKNENNKALIDAETEAADSSEAYIFKCMGDYWKLRYNNGKLIHLKAVKGFQYLDILLKHPNKAYDAVVLVNYMDRIDDELVSSNDSQKKAAKKDYYADDVNAILDRKAKNDFYKRVEDLRGMRDAAMEAGAISTARKCELELELIREEIRKCIDKRGKSREFANIPKRARTRVGNAISRCLDKIKEENLELYKHLHNSIRTGHQCSYAPDKSISWTF
jgi:hypothetical protein